MKIPPLLGGLVGKALSGVGALLSFGYVALRETRQETVTAAQECAPECGMVSPEYSGIGVALVGVSVATVVTLAVARRSSRSGAGEKEREKA